MQLAEVAVLHDVAELGRARADDGAQALGRLDGAGQDGGVERGRISQLARLEEAVGQRGDLAAAEHGQPGAALGAADDAVDVALGLAVADQHDAGGAGAGRRPQDAGGGLGAAVSTRRWRRRRPAHRAARRGSPATRRGASRQVADELLELAQGPALDDVVAVGAVLADDGVARAPVVTRLGVQPEDVAGPRLEVLDDPRLGGVVVVARVAEDA